MSGFGDAPPADHNAEVHAGSAAGDLPESPVSPSSPPLWLSEEEERQGAGGGWSHDEEEAAAPCGQ